MSKCYGVKLLRLRHNQYLYVVSDDETSFHWPYAVIGILVILLLVALGFVVFLKRNQNQPNFKSEFVTEGQTPTQTSLQNYDNLTISQETYPYATTNSEMNESPYHNLP